MREVESRYELITEDEDWMTQLDSPDFEKMPREVEAERKCSRRSPIPTMTAFATGTLVPASAVYHTLRWET